MTAPLGRACAAEALATGWLLAVVVGSGIMAERLAGGSEGLALLANALATAAALPVIILCAAPASGAHLNPAVTLAFWMRGEVGGRRALGYAAAQAAGAIMGVWLAHLMFDLPALQWGAKSRAAPHLWLSEAVATAGLLATVLGVRRAQPDAVPWAVGAYVGAAYWFTASTAFANPAVTLARGFTQSFAGIAPAGVPAFWVAQLLAAASVATAAAWFSRPARA